jgi:hypothetical protein
LIRKKFLSFCGKGLWLLGCLFDDIERPEKFRFSLGKEFGVELWNKVVIEDGWQLSRELLLVLESSLVGVNGVSSASTLTLDRALGGC